VIKEICSPNETLPDSPSFQNAQDTDSEPVGQSSQDNTNIIHSSGGFVDLCVPEYVIPVLELPTNLTSTLSFSMWTGGNVC
jgi:hypothetical protein